MALLLISDVSFDNQVQVMLYARVRKSKNYFEIPAFLPIERGISRAGKFKVILHFAATEKFLFSFEFPALEVPRSKFKKAALSK